ncbi:MAG: SRPBCC family protein, partial [Actinomycetota bacterium]|nr:SRPBCC family protein [Actinomycetota bacterium]
ADPTTDDGHVRAHAAITVNRPPGEVYRLWRDVENLPRFMAHLESVHGEGDVRSHWVARAPGGRTVEWDAEVVEDLPGELVAWRSLQGADVANSGTVRLAPAPGGRGTEVRVEVEYQPPLGAVGAAAARLFGEQPAQQIEDDLRRFKQVVETGEVVRSEGSPDGTRTQRQLHQRDAQPLL